ncbi:site-specific integrase [Endozoicomonas sp. G2_1]|uniref:site-specific integrase n=1 Tax=Endozoicomonas sp. G2_1 TaxID=2821091 RepID=UPI001ADA9433|nr:site-specific integrase [Endozoicomonas sp. G2_1]MBO9492057.1 site-specific integrase [Endozoicomonas sp. G2_1]
MASIIKRNRSARATIKHKSLEKPLVKTFGEHPTFEENKKAAEQWVEKKEAELTLGAHIDMSAATQIYFDELLVRYRDEILSKKEDNSRDLSKVRVIRAAMTGIPIEFFTTRADLYDHAQESGYTLDQINFDFICGFISHRLFIEGVAWDTVNKDLQLIQNVLKTSCVGWGINVHGNAITDGIKKFDILNPEYDRKEGVRERRTTMLENQLLFDGQSKYSLIAEFAVETAMRRGEIARLVPADLHGNILEIHKTKTDRKQRKAGRVIPISPRAVEIFESFAKHVEPDELLFGCSDPKSLSQGFDRLCERLNIDDLRFHDLRHEGTSRLFEQGWEIQQVASITGHTNWKTLQRYTHLNPRSLGNMYKPPVTMVAA